MQSPVRQVASQRAKRIKVLRSHFGSSHFGSSHFGSRARVLARGGFPACNGAMPKRSQRHGAADSDGFRPVRGRSCSRARARSASGARDASKTRASTNTFKWECWGNFAGRRCGKQCVGVQNCTRCGRSAPDKAWAVKNNREPNGPLLIEIDAAAWQKSLMSLGDNNEE